MKRLSNLEFRQLLGCIAELYEETDLHRLRRRLPSIVAKLVPADLTFLNTFNLQRRDLPAVYSACPENTNLNFDPEFTNLVYQEHPCLQHIARTKSMAAVKITDFMSARQYRQTRLYAEGLRLYGVEYNIGFQVQEPNPPEITSISQVRDRCDFSEADRFKLNLLRTHVARAYLHAEQMAAWRTLAASASEALTASGQAIIVLSAGGSIVLCTNKAREYLVYFFKDEARKNSSLPAKLRDWMRQQDLPGSNSGRVPRPRQPFIAERDGSRLTVHLLSCGRTGQRLLLLEERRLKMSAEPLQRHLRLTARRAEVLFWIAQGKTSEEIAIILGLSISTVRKHTERIFEQLGVETRTAAARQATEIMNGREFFEFTPPPASRI